MAPIQAERDRYRDALELIAALLPEDSRAIAKQALNAGEQPPVCRQACPCERSDEGSVICWVCGDLVRPSEELPEDA